MIIGTCYFISLAAARSYYSFAWDDSKLELGEVCIGRPVLKEGERLLINKKEGRYLIESD